MEDRTFTTRTGILIGVALATGIGVVFAAALRAGMSASGLDGGPELMASFLFLLTLPAGAIAAMVGRLAMPLGLETAFAVTGVAWMLLSVPYAVLVMHGLGAIHRRGTLSR